MKTILIFLVCLTLLARSCAQSDESDFSDDLLDEIWSLITNKTIQHFGCKSHHNFTNDDIGYYLYTRPYGNSSNLTPNNLNEFNMTKPIKMIFPGWLAKIDEPKLLALVEAYLTRYDCNVIIVDNTKLTNTQYSQAYCNIIIGAKLIGDFMCEMHKEGYLDFDNLHMVGISLGAQFTGLIGQSVQQQCNQTVDRISGMDPSGPIYQGKDVSERLDKSDAKFVDVIHTNMGMFGYYGSVGHVDFFPNCGIVQPGCASLVGTTNILKVLYNFINCCHTRSTFLFIESVYGPVFNATSCTSCPGNKGLGIICKGGDIINPKYAIMGEDCPRNPPAAKFVLKTNSKPPFAQG